MTTDRMRSAPARLLIDKGSKNCLRLKWLCFNDYGDILKSRREKLLNRAGKEERILDDLASDPASLSVKQQLRLSRAHISRRAKKVRPRLKGG